MDELADSRLVELAQAGDEDAFLELASRYFDALYDFAVRLVGGPDEAEELVAASLHETLFDLTLAAPGLQGPDAPSFRASVFAAARSVALARLEHRPVHPSASARGDDRDPFDIVDESRLNGPVDAAEAAALAPAVWQAAQALDARQLSLLDLQLRQGLDRDELAAVAGVTPENSDVLLTRLQSTAGDALAAFILAQPGPSQCDDLAAALVVAPVRVLGAPSPLAPDLRRLVDHHVEHCAACAERRAQLASPLDVFAALAPVAASAGARARVLGALADAWPEAMIDATAARRPAFANSRVDSIAVAGRRVGSYQPALPTAADWRGNRAIRAFAGLGVAAAAMLALLVLPGSPIALTRSQAGLATSKSGTVGNQQGSGDAGTAGPTVFVIVPETATATPTNTRTPAARGSVGAGISSTSSAQVGAGSPGAESSTATPTLVPPTPTQPPTVVIPPTATPTRQATAGPPTPTTVPTPCTGALTTNLVDNQLNASTGRTSFEILNQSDCASGAYAVAVVGAGAGWLTVSPSAGALSAHSGDTIGVTADLSAVPGGAAAAIRVVWPGGAFFVTVIVSGAEP